MGKMNKSELVTRLAEQTHLSKAEAADQLDRVVHQIVRNLRQGKPARLPGLGSFRPGEKWQFRFDAEIRPGGKRAGD
jgi:nucleoid DNA-binding protein